MGDAGLAPKSLTLTLSQREREEADQRFVEILRATNNPLSLGYNFGMRRLVGAFESGDQSPHSTAHLSNGHLLLSSSTVPLYTSISMSYAVPGTVYRQALRFAGLQFCSLENCQMV